MRSSIAAAVAGLALAVISLLVLAGTRRVPEPPATAAEAVMTPEPAPGAPGAIPAAAAATEAADASTPVVAARAPEPEFRIRISLDRRRLWLLRDADTLMTAAVAIGMNDGFEYRGRKFHFATPRGTRRVLGKARDPVWTPPDWHYLEKAAQRGLEAVKLEKDSRIELSDGSILVVQGDQVGRINTYGNFAAIVPGNEIIFDEKIFIPPPHTAQRRVPDALGPYKLDMGDGYLIHGTHVYNEESIGEAVSHGCVRMDNDDLERLYRFVPTGTVVEIF